jgi:hypothetical protein
MATPKFMVKRDSDGIGYYVEEQVCDIGYLIHGVSMSRQEMVELAEQLNKEYENGTLEHSSRI